MFDRASRHRRKYPRSSALRTFSAFPKDAHGGSDVFMNELEGWVKVAESVAAVRDLIIKAGDSVTASQVVEGGGKPIRLQPVETPRDRE